MEQRLHIKNIASHYYLPLLVSNDEKIDYITRVIHVSSEIRFVNQLEAYIKEPDNLFSQYDWWMFSRADETLDKITIPYYDPTKNKISNFHPDFIFWLSKGKQYTVLFVDPKGMTATDYQYKIDGYKELFRDSQTGLYREFKHSGYKVSVALAMYTTDSNRSPKEYRDYWYDNPKQMLEKLK